MTRYTVRGSSVEVVVRWATLRPAGEPRFPLVATRAHAPRNVAVRYDDGTVVVRPFRGLRRERTP